MPAHDIIVIGASSGGLRALEQLCGALPADLPAAVFIVWHTHPRSPAMLAPALDRRGPLPAAVAQDGQPIRPGRIYVAPPDQHLLLARDRVRVIRGPRENRFRPAVDPLFRTAARALGPRVIGVVLSGTMDDGTEGLLLIKRHGGVAIVQDPADAEAPDMPASAIRHVPVDHVLPLADIPRMLAKLAREATSLKRADDMATDDQEQAASAAAAAAAADPSLH